MAKVLISGATSGVAREVAQLYAARGDQLFLLGRDREKLAQLSRSLGDCVLGHTHIDALAYDDCQRAIATAWADHDGFDIALIAHGWLGDQLRAEADQAHARAILELNASTVISQLVALQPRFTARGHGHIAVCSSVAADRGRPRNFTYAAAKAAIETYLEGLRSVLWPHVQVHCLALGPVDTAMTATHEKNFSFSQPRDTARGIVRAIDRGRFKAYIPRWWGPVMWGVRHLPEPVFQRLRFLSAR